MAEKVERLGQHPSTENTAKQGKKHYGSCENCREKKGHRKSSHKTKRRLRSKLFDNHLREQDHAGFYSRVCLLLFLRFSGAAREVVRFDWWTESSCGVPWEWPEKRGGMLNHFFSRSFFHIKKLRSHSEEESCCCSVWFLEPDISHWILSVRWLVWGSGCCDAAKGAREANSLASITINPGDWGCNEIEPERTALLKTCWLDAGRHFACKASTGLKSWIGSGVIAAGQEGCVTDFKQDLPWLGKTFLGSMESEMAPKTWWWSEASNFERGNTKGADKSLLDEDKQTWILAIGSSCGALLVASVVSLVCCEDEARFDAGKVACAHFLAVDLSAAASTSAAAASNISRLWWESTAVTWVAEACKWAGRVDFERTYVKVNALSTKWKAITSGRITECISCFDHARIQTRDFTKHSGLVITSRTSTYTRQRNANLFLALNREYCERLGWHICVVVALNLLEKICLCSLSWIYVYMQVYVYKYPYIYAQGVPPLWIFVKITGFWAVSMAWWEFQSTFLFCFCAKFWFLPEQHWP